MRLDMSMLDPTTLRRAEADEEGDLLTNEDLKLQTFALPTVSNVRIFNIYTH